MKLKEICSFLDSSVPLSFQESYDNSGLQVGMAEKEIKAALLTVDVTEEVMDEAIKEKCDLIISHHPLLFSGIKSLSGRSAAERIIIEAVKHNIAVYSSHTSLDVIRNGVSWKMAEKLQLKNIRVISPLKGRLLKLVTYIPESHFQSVCNALFDAGAGVIGNYDRCGFSVSGKGSFRAGNNTSPFVGEIGEVHSESEMRFETVLLSHLRSKVVRALLESHPYEEVAYDIYTLDNEYTGAGMGCAGDLTEALDEIGFLKLVSQVFGTKGLRHTKITGKKVSKVSLCGGSGAFLLNDAISLGADAFVTGDIKYHTWLEAENQILLVDIGHFESEKYSTEILYEIIIKKFPKFAVRFSKVNTNPINYY